jgi:hypothetical protein
MTVRRFAEHQFAVPQLKVEKDFVVPGAEHDVLTPGRRRPGHRCAQQLGGVQVDGARECDRTGNGACVKPHCQLAAIEAQRHGIKVVCQRRLNQRPDHLHGRHRVALSGAQGAVDVSWNGRAASP